ncbi:MAG: Spy/CpxP family protein refolding chaperone [Acidobacteriota bacterium]
MKRAVLAMMLLALAVPALADETPEQPRGKEAIIRYLSLTDAQVEQWDALIESREATVSALREQLRGVEEQLRDLLKGENPDAQAVGALVISGRNLREQIEEANKAYLEGFEALLTREQAARLAGMRRVARLAPLVPAFVHFGLVPRDLGRP